MIQRLLWFLGGFRQPCRWFGHARDWPEMEQCCWCGTHIPLLEEPLLCNCTHGPVPPTLYRDRVIGAAEVAILWCGLCGRFEVAPRDRSDPREPAVIDRWNRLMLRDAGKRAKPKRVPHTPPPEWRFRD